MEGYELFLRDNPAFNRGRVKRICQNTDDKQAMICPKCGNDTAMKVDGNGWDNDRTWCRTAYCDYQIEHEGSTMSRWCINCKDHDKCKDDEGFKSFGHCEDFEEWE